MLKEETIKALLVNDRDTGKAYALKINNKKPEEIQILLHYLENLFGIRSSIEVLQVFGLESFGEYYVKKIDNTKEEFYQTLESVGIM